MSAPSTRPRRKFWGWGREGEGLSPAEREGLLERAGKRWGSALAERRPVPPPEEGEIELRAPRVELPSALAADLGDAVSTIAHERLVHSYGKSFPDALRAFQRHYPEPPDLVVTPRDEAQIERLLEWCGEQGVAVVPFGGGSSVVGGVESAVRGDYRGVVSLDLGRLDRVLEVDRTSRAARIQAGVLGPALEAQLQPHELTLRHFPQSFEHSTLGGWIATRSGGHFASLYTHIDDLVESVRAVTPAGVWESRRLPGSGAGPSPDRLLIGSEGILGVITEAWMRLQDRPRHRASSSAWFESFEAGAEAVRALSQSGLFPSNCRLIDAAEAAATGVGDGERHLLVLGFESGDHPVEAWMRRALELVAGHGGAVPQRPDADQGPDAPRDAAAGAWRHAFLRAPYAREVLVPYGVIVDTFETAVTWDRFPEVHAALMARTAEALREATGRDGSVTCRFTHVYPDGPAPYYTFQVLGDADLAVVLRQWCEIKRACNAAVAELGATATHHHAVGRDHRSAYDRQRPEPFALALGAAKAAVDPHGVLNPGVLIDVPDRGAGGGGILG
ncbi:MAG: FAD-binding oxidoreductase [Acidobacteria bacterium]|nr:MAG: FAD-binding oxidoreductase [Acidobacteriota bacterium]REK10627.1 MAG: FAD-binding oxidoreductase [Acidobacteriota bacterium]